MKIAALTLIFAMASPAAAQTWQPYDIHGMSYLYGMVVDDFGAGKKVAYSDSFASTRNFLRNDTATIYLTDKDGPVPVFEENAEYHPTHPGPAPHVLPERMIAVDVNDDGWKDIVAVVNSHNSVVAYVNPGNSGDPWSRMVLTLNTPGAVNLAAGDFDGDGDLDIAVTMRGNTVQLIPNRPGLGWLRNDGGGSWSYSDIQVNAGMSEPRGLIATNIFNQGKAEIIVTDQNTGVARAYRLNNGAWQIYTVSGVSSASVYNIALDVTGDGLAELIYATSSGIYAAEVSHTVSGPPITKLADISLNAGAKITEFAAGNLVGTSGAEIAFSTTGDGLYYLEKSGGSWLLRSISTDPENYHSIALMDFDGNGKLDVLSGIEYQRNALQVWRNPN